MTDRFTKDNRVIEKKLRYQIRHPTSPATSFASRFSPKRIIHNLGWMTIMVSSKDAKEVFGRAFSRPPRLLFTNPVCAIFSIYYAYIYGPSLSQSAVCHADRTAIIYVFLVSVPLAFGVPPYSRTGLFSYEWPQATLSLAYVGLGKFLFLSSLPAVC